MIEKMERRPIGDHSATGDASPESETSHPGDGRYYPISRTVHRSSPSRAMQVAILCLSCTFTPAAGLEGQQKVEIPEAGVYGYEGILQGVVEGPNAQGVRALPGPIHFANRFYLEPSECGATLTIRAPDGSMLLVLDYMDDHWFGELWTGPALLKTKLYPRDRTTVEGHWHVKIDGMEGAPMPPEMAGRALYRLETPAAMGPNAGAGALYNPYDNPGGEQVIATRYGPWVEEDAPYTTVVWDFYVNDSELLPLHEQSLQEAISYMKIADDHACHSEEFRGISRVVGFASQTGPEKNNDRIAADRARSVSDYLSQHASDFFPPAEYRWGFGSYSDRGDEPLHDLPGLEASCNRAAAFTFWKKRRYVDLHTEAEAREWLENWLRHAEQIDDPSRREVERCAARGRFQFALNMIDLVEAGHCTPPPSEPVTPATPEGGPSPAWEFLRDDPAAEDRSVEAALLSAYELAADLTAKRYAHMYEHGQAQQQDRDRALNDPYFRYSLYAENPRAEAIAAEVDARVFGEAAECVPQDRSGIPW